MHRLFPLYPQVITTLSTVINTIIHTLQTSYPQYKAQLSTINNPNYTQLRGNLSTVIGKVIHSYKQSYPQLLAKLSTITSHKDVDN